MKVFLAFLICLFTTSCVTSMSGDDFHDEVLRTSGGKRSGSGMESDILYKGSNDTHHHFLVIPRVGMSRSIKVLKEELIIRDQYPLSENEDEWVSYSTVK